MWHVEFIILPFSPVVFPLLFLLIILLLLSIQHIGKNSNRCDDGSLKAHLAHLLDEGKKKTDPLRRVKGTLLIGILKCLLRPRHYRVISRNVLEKHPSVASQKSHSQTGREQKHKTPVICS